MIDKDTGAEHNPPIGFEHHDIRSNGHFYLAIKIPHHLIVEHQRVLPELVEKMKNKRHANRIYAAFLVMLPFEVSGTLTPELKQKIMKAYKII